MNFKKWLPLLTAFVLVVLAVSACAPAQRPTDDVTPNGTNNPTGINFRNNDNNGWFDRNNGGNGWWNRNNNLNERDTNVGPLDMDRDGVADTNLNRNNNGDLDRFDRNGTVRDDDGVIDDIPDRPAPGTVGANRAPR